MRDFADRLQLSPLWWWGTVAAIVVVALIFLGAGSVTAALVCVACAIGVAALALSAGPPRPEDQRRHEEETA